MEFRQGGTGVPSGFAARQSRWVSRSEVPTGRMSQLDMRRDGTDTHSEWSNQALLAGASIWTSASLRAPSQIL